MKNFLKNICKIAIFIAIIFFICISLHEVKYYNRKGTVLSISNNIINVDDGLGMTWELYSIVKFNKGEEVVLIVNSQGTDNVADDIVEGVRRK